MLESFADEICTYLATNSGARFTYGSGNTNLKLGELRSDGQGVYAVTQSSAEPDKYTTVQYLQLDFWARNADSAVAEADLRFIYNLFHKNQNWTTTNFICFFSSAIGGIDDMDRDPEGCKLMRLGINFIYSNLIS